MKRTPSLERRQGATEGTTRWGELTDAERGARTPSPQHESALSPPGILGKGEGGEITDPVRLSPSAGPSHGDPEASTQRRRLLSA